MLHNKRQLLKAFGLLVLCVAAAVTYAILAANELRACVGDLCVRPTFSQEAEVIAGYGPGLIVRGGKSPIEDDRTRCYFDATANTYALVTFWHAHEQQMRVSHVFVSTEPLCKQPAPASKPFTPIQLRTPISLGDTEAMVLKKIGSPSREDNPKKLEKQSPELLNEPGYGSRYGEKKWVYFPEGEDSLLGWSIHFQNGKVKSIGLWDSP